MIANPAPERKRRAGFVHRGTRAIEHLIEHAPASGSLALWVGHVEVTTETGSACTLATDGRALHYAPSFETLSLERQAGEVARAVLHVALRHVQRAVALRARIGDLDARLYAVCADAIVNTSLGNLVWLALPEGAVTLERLLLNTLGVHADPVRLLVEWDVERLYRALDDRAPARGGQSREDGPRAQRTRVLGGDTPIRLDLGPAQREAPEGEAEFAREWAQRLVRAHAGDGEWSMLRSLGADLPGSRVPWEQTLRVRLARGLARQPETSWSRPARSWLANQGRDRSGRRMPFEPGTVSARREPRLAVIVDVSGSIDDALLARLGRELAALSRRAHAGMVRVIGDDQVREVRVLAAGEDALEGLRVAGGGGTDFGPLLREADRHRPDIGVVLTDLDGPTDFRPSWPVIWAVPLPQALRAQAPFGRVLALD